MFDTPRITPHETEHCEGDSPSETHELNIQDYGDCYDPKAPLRVREVGRDWKFDPDHDGDKG